MKSSRALPWGKGHRSRSPEVTYWVVTQCTTGWWPCADIPDLCFPSRIKAYLKWMLASFLSVLSSFPGLGSSPTLSSAYITFSQEVIAWESC